MLTVAVLTVFLASVFPVYGAYYGIYNQETINLSLYVTVGDQYGTSFSETISLSVSVTLANQMDIGFSETISLSVSVSTPEYLNLLLTQNLGLSVSITLGEEAYVISWYWVPDDPVLWTQKNYSYYCTLTYLGDPQEANITIAFDDLKITDKNSNSTGQFSFWAVVSSQGLHTWTFVVYQEGSLVSIIYKPLTYGQEIPQGREGGWLPTIPIDISVWINGLVAYLPAIIIIAIFMFFGNLLAGGIGILGGLIAGIFVDVAVAFLPQYILFFLILIGILFVIFKLKKPSNGGGPA